MKVVAISLVILLSLIYCCNVAEGNHTKYTFVKSSSSDHEHYLAVAERFRYLEKYTKKTINSAIKMVLPYVMEFSEKVKINVSKECMNNAMALMIGIKNIKPWAFKFIDASGKIPDGMMYGSISAAGHYEECLDIEVKSTSKKDFGKKLFQGQYCMLEAKALLYLKKPKAIYMLDFSPEMKKIIESESIFSRFAKYIYFVHLGGLRIGLCVPSGCSKEDINSVLNSVIGNPNTNVSALSCEIKEKNTYTTATILVFCYYALIASLVLFGSIIDYYTAHNNIVVKSKAIQSLIAFSFVTNFRRFCAPSANTDNIKCLNGMKFFGMTWVLIGHSIMSGLGPFIHGIIRYEHYTQEIPFQAILNAMTCVDTFFIIGAFLVSFLTTKHVILGKQKFSIVHYIVHRLWRIYPTYIALLTTIAIIPLVSSGPYYKEATSVILDPCYRNWWQNLLFISNFFEPNETCFLHTWYLTTDFQLYILSLAVLLPLIRWPKVGLIILFLGIVANILYALILSYINEWPPAMLFSLMDLDEMIELWKYMYFVPWSHFGPYGIGILVGYIYGMNPNYKMSRLTQVLGWCIAFTCSFSVLYATRDWYIKPMPRYVAAIYAGFTRTSWAVGPAWILYACATGHGGIINWILSWRIFTHLGRLSFSAYIIHLVIVTIVYSGVKTRQQADLHISVWFFFGLLCTSLAIAFILHLFIEIPFLNLERVLFLSPKKKTENSEKELKEDNFEDEFKTEKNGGIIILESTINNCSTKL